MEDSTEDFLEDVDKKIIEKIKKVRKEKGINQQQMAEMLGISQVTYSSIELGRIEIGVKRLIKVVHFLGIQDIFENNTENHAIKDLTVIDDFESFLKKFLEQSKIIDDLKQQSIQQTTDNQEIVERLKNIEQENTEIKALLHLVLQKLSE